MDQHAAPHLLVLRRLPRGREGPTGEHPNILFFGEGGKRAVVDARGDDDFHELTLNDGAGRRFVQGFVESNDAPESAGGIGGEGAVVGFREGGRCGYATGIRVLHNHAGRCGEGRYTLQGRIRIRNVVIGQSLTLQLNGSGHRAHLGPASASIEGGTLMRVFSVAKPLPAFQGEVAGFGHDYRGALVIPSAQPIGHGSIVGGGMGKGPGGEAVAKGKVRRAVLRLEGFEHPVVIPGIGHHRHPRVILGRGTHHGRTTDIDVLNRVP